MDPTSLNLLHLAATEFMPILALWGALDRLVFAKMRQATAEILARIKALEEKAAKRDVSDALISQRVEYLEKLQK